MTHIEAILASMRTTGYPASFVDVPSGTSYPYAFMWGISHGEMDQTDLEGNVLGIDQPFHITSVAFNTIAAVKVAQQIRGAFKNSPPALAGWDIVIKFMGSEFVSVDRKITIEETNIHPAFAVESFRLISTRSRRL